MYSKLTGANAAVNFMYSKLTGANAAVNLGEE